MNKKIRCRHVEWIYDRRTCCYVLRCAECSITGTAYHVKGPMPAIGDRVRLVGEIQQPLVNYGETMEKV